MPAGGGETPAISFCFSSQAPAFIEEELATMVADQPSKFPVDLRLVGNPVGGQEGSALEQLWQSRPRETEPRRQQKVDLSLRDDFG